MADPFLGEIRLVSFDFAPQGWAFCNGQILQIQQNQALFALLGTTYGGDGATTFALPNLQGRSPMHQGNGFAIGVPAGADEVTLSVEQMPAHSHDVHANDTGATTSDPAGAIFADGGPYVKSVGNIQMGQVNPVGLGWPVPVVQPTLVLNFVIAMAGIFPSQG